MAICPFTFLFFELRVEGALDIHESDEEDKTLIIACLLTDLVNCRSRQPYCVASSQTDTVERLAKQKNKTK